MSTGVNSKLTLQSDTFTGAYAAEYVRQKVVEEKWNIKKAVVRACAAGTLSVTKAGAQEGIPWADSIDRFILETSADLVDNDR